MLAWDYELANDVGAAELRLSVRLARSPFKLERTMRVEAGKPVLILRERITNEGGEPVDYMWGHHPAFGAPFLGATCRIDTNARTVVADDVYDSPFSPVTPGQQYEWPNVGRNGAHANLSRVPGPDQSGTVLAYFTDFEGEAAWYGVTNAELGFGVGMVWPVSAFPHAWFWQEMHASAGFPWYKGVYVMAIEPSTSYPGQGLINVMEKTGLHRTLEPSESAEAELRAVFFEPSTGISAIDLDGSVTTAE